MAKRILSFVLVLAMLVSLMPQVTVGVSAEGSKAPGASEWCDHTNHDGWTAVSTAAQLPTSQSGNYYLTENIDLSGDQWSVSGNVHLCLNGHNLTQKTSGKRVIYLSGSGQTLSVYDCTGNGKITGGTSSTGSAINVTRKNTFSFYGGKITDNDKSGASGVVYVQAATADGGRGGVFNMYGGEISGNEIKDGIIYGAGGVDGLTNSQVNIYGGTIQNNQASGTGGAIYVKTYGSLHIENATITGNKAGSAGSAIYAQNNTPITIKNTTITGNIGTSTHANSQPNGWTAAVYACGEGNVMTLSGKVVISGNTTAYANTADISLNHANNSKLYVDELAAGSDVVFRTMKAEHATADGAVALASGGSQSGTWTSQWLTYMDATGATKGITYGASGFYFVDGHYHGDQKYDAWTGGAMGTGFYYLSGDVESSAAVSVSGDVKLCFCGSDIIAQTAGNRVFAVAKGGKLTLEDCTATTDAQGNYVAGGITAKSGLTMTRTYGGLINVNCGGTLNMTGGKIYGVTNTAEGGSPVYLQGATTTNGKAVFNMTGGEISGNTAKAGTIQMATASSNADTANLSELNIDGGRILNNTATVEGGAIRVSLGKVTIKNAKINGNAAPGKIAGALYVTGATSVVVVEDTEFTNNSAESASAINLLSSAQLTLKNVTITGNTNGARYGAVNIGNGSAVLKLEGKTVIYDNLNSSNTQQNLHLQDGATIDVDVSGLAAGAKVGVSLLAARITNGLMYFSTEGMTSNPGYCVSDDSDTYEVKLNETSTRLELAEKTVAPPEPPVVQTHTHCICGDDACTKTDGIHEQITYEAWGDDAAETGLPTDGKYYLYKDVNVTAVTTVSDDLDLCLNGKTISANCRIFAVNKNKTLRITDCADAYTGTEYTGGKLTGGRNNNGSAVYVNEDAVFSLYAGRITNCGPVDTANAQSGAPVYLRSTDAAGATFNMYGGEITGNGGAKSWGGAATNGGGNTTNTVYINMYGGKIFDNTALYGGAFRVKNSAVVTIYGGEICDNEATNGGGAIYVDIKATLDLQGGNIHDNTAAVSGAGIFLSATANATVSGTPVVKDNTVDSKQNNLYLDGNAVFTVGQLATGAKIGLSRADSRNSANVSANTVAETQLTYFSNDNTEKFELKLREGYLALSKVAVALPDHIHCLCGAEKTLDATCAACGSKAVLWTAKEQLPNENGYFYLTKDVNLTAVASITGDMHLCLNDKALKQTAANTRVMNVESGANVTITDCGTNGKITGGSGTYGTAISVRTNSVLNMYGGKITENKRTNSGSAEGTVYIQSATATANGGVFNMYGGEISGNKVSRGGAVSLASTANDVTNPNWATFNLYGGALKNNEVVVAESKGGMGGAINISGAGIVNITGGEISGNKAETTGGAIYTAVKAVVAIADAQITNNEAGTAGGAIRLYNEAKSLTVSGNTVIQNNKADGKVNNVHMIGDIKLTVGNLTAGAKIGLTREESRMDEVVSANTVDAAVFACFTNDDAQNYQLKHKNGYVALSMLTEHMHNLCNNSACTMHTDEVPYVKWTKTDSLPESGNWYLDKDVELTAVAEVSKDLNLCLNGKTIKQTKANTRVLNVKDGAVVTISDCGDGKLTGGSGTYGTAISVRTNSTLNMYGGKITGNVRADNAEAEGTVYIQAATATANGGVFNMYGGEISDNKVSRGGAVSLADIKDGVTNPNWATFNLYGGALKNNEVVVVNGKGGMGGAINISGAGIVNLQGGEISGNKAATAGGAVYVLPDASVTAGGAVVVKDNTVNGTKNNVHLIGDATIAAADGFASDCYVGITAEKVERKVVTGVTMPLFANHFGSDSAYKNLIYKEAEQALYVEGSKDHQHCACTSNATGCDHSKLVWTAWENTGALPASGNYYLTEDVQLSAVASVTGELNLCLNGHTVTAADGRRVITVAKNTGVLNLTDCSSTSGALTGGTGTWGAAVNINTGATFNMFGGKITGNKNVANDGGVGAIYVQGAGAVFNMYGGEISGNEGVLSTIYAPKISEGDAMQINLYGGKICNNKSVQAKTGEGELIGGNGGAILANSAKLTIVGGEISGNTAQGHGGAIYIANKTEMTIDNGVIQNNTAEGNGGGVLATSTGTVVTMNGGKITGNKAKNGGGLITQTRSKFVFNGGEISNNQVTAGGGGAYISTNTQFEMNGGLFTGNKANNGAGFFCYRSEAVVNGGQVIGNAASNRGGAAVIQGAKAELNKLTISGNTGKDAGAAYIYGATYESGNEEKYEPSVVTIAEGVVITENKAESNSGGILLANADTVVTMNGGLISKNESAYGAGVMIWSGATFHLKGGQISEHTTASEGGAIYASTGSKLKMEGGSITGNTAVLGGGVYFYRSTGLLTGGTISGNHAKHEIVVTNGKETKSGGNGGAIYVRGAEVTLGGTDMTGNIADGNGGAVATARYVTTIDGEKTVFKPVLTMTAGTISGNKATNAGGVLTQTDTMFTLKGGLITKNEAATAGGGIYISTSSALKMEGGTVSKNTAKNGGGIYFLRSEGELSGGNVDGNYAKGTKKVSNGTETISNGNGGAIYVSGAEVKLSGANLTNNTADGNGGAVVTGRYTLTSNGVKSYIAPELTMTAGTISGNKANNAGGILTQTDTVFYFKGGLVTRNEAASGGGGIYISTKSTMHMTGGSVVNNYAEKQGGGLYLLKCTANITGGQINSNTSETNSGNMMINGNICVVNVKNMKIHGGESNTAGAVVVQGKATLNMENCEIYDNKTLTSNGGAVYVSNKSFGNFTNCRFFDNESANCGGAVLVNNFGNATFKDCQFDNNKAAKQGGAVWCSVASKTTMENCTFTNNTAGERGGAVTCKGDMVMTNCVLENNTAGTDGGAIYTDVNTTTGSGIMKGLEVHNSVIKNNKASKQGGGLFIHKGCKVKLYDTEITGNTSGAEGSAMWVYEDLEIHGATITGNTSATDGYAVYMNDAMYDGHSYYTSHNKLSGNVIIKDNKGGNLWMGPDVVFAITADGLGENTHIELAMDSGVVTNRIFGAYHYEGGDQVYTITYGDRSMTDPEYDASLVKGTEEEQTENAAADVILYAGIGVFAAAIIAVAAVLITKKKKAGKTAEEATKE